MLNEAHNGYVGGVQTVHLTGGDGADMFQFNVGYMGGNGSVADAAYRNYVVHDFQLGIDSLGIKVATDVQEFNFPENNSAIQSISSTMYNGVASTSITLMGHGNSGNVQITLVGVDPSVFTGGSGFPG